MDEIDISEWFYYDESSPTRLRWKKQRYKINGAPVHQATPHSVAGIRTGGQVQVRLFYKLYYGHRIVYELLKGKIPEGMVVDHIDGNPLNNSIDNLRVTTQKTNCRNFKKKVNNKSGKTGVFRFVHKKSGPYWRAFWADLEGGKEMRKDFSVRKYGEEVAKKLAEDLRAKMIEELNAQGAGYTERHGK